MEQRREKKGEKEREGDEQNRQTILLVGNNT